VNFIASPESNGLAGELHRSWTHAGDSCETERCSGIGLKLFGFIPEPAFTFIPESRSESSRNTVRNHPGIAFTLPRIPQHARE
jgi:hypothetical protein